MPTGREDVDVMQPARTPRLVVGCRRGLRGVGASIGQGIGEVRASTAIYSTGAKQYGKDQSCGDPTTMTVPGHERSWWRSNTRLHWRLQLLDMRREPGGLSDVFTT
jgi:hypothetical protein